MTNSKQYSDQALDIAKVVLIAVVGFKAISIINNLGKDTSTGGGQGTSDDTEYCDGWPFVGSTYTKQQFSAFADALEAAFLASRFTEDDNAAGAILMQMRTLDDVLSLVCAFGVRSIGFFGITTGHWTLPQIITDLLDDNVKDDVNENYRDKDIDVQW